MSDDRTFREDVAQTSRSESTAHRIARADHGRSGLSARVRVNRLVAPDLNLDVVLEVPELVSFARIGLGSAWEPEVFNEARKLLEPVHDPVVGPGWHADPEVSEKAHRREAVRVGDTDLLRRQIS